MSEHQTEQDGARTQLTEYLARNGMKQTRQREAILESFLGVSGHITSENLYEYVRAQYPDIGAATVYRALKLFCDAGLAHALHFQDGVTLYEHEGHHHDHLICVGCGEIVEFECDDIEDFQLRIARDHGYRLTKHRHHLYGYCAKCQSSGTDRK